MESSTPHPAHRTATQSMFSRGSRDRLTRIGAARRRRASAFTLIEILVVVAIIALLVAILLPSLHRARENAKTVQCVGQIRELMRAALIYTADFKERLPGVGRSDADYEAQYDSGFRKDWLTWFGTWTVLFSYADKDTDPAWDNAPQGGRLYKYYQDPNLLRCPRAVKYNGKLSYSTPENVALAMRDTKPTSSPNWRAGLPPIMSKVKHPSLAIQFLDEDEEYGLSNYSLDDGFGEGDRFAERHLGKASVAFFDGHASAYYFPHGREGHYARTRTDAPFEAWLIQIAPFNCRYTPRPWRWTGVANMPKFKSDTNWPYNADRSNGPGVE